ncbi:MAG: methyl-accepting chemotaxis protein [Pseudomonadota bacterium]
MGALTIRAKVAAACVVIVVVALGSSGLAFYQSHVQGKSVAAATAGLRTLEAINAYFGAVDESRRAILKMLVLGRMKYVGQFEEEAAHARERYGLLVDALSHGPVDQTAVDLVSRIDGLFNQWVERVARAQISDMNNRYTFDMARVREAQPDTIALWGEMDELARDLRSRTQAEDRQHLAQVTRSQTQLQIILAVSGAVLFLVALAIGALFFSTIIRPLRQLKTATGRLTARDWQTEIPRTDAQDEVGELARALDMLRNDAKENEAAAAARLKEAQLQVERAAHVRTATKDFQDETEKVFRDLEQAGASLSNAATSLSDTAGASHSFTRSVSTSAQKTGSSVQSVAASIEEMSISVSEISRQMQKTSSLVDETTGASKNAITQVSGLKQKSEKIHDVIELINGIAGQINMLALNATIESARAGEAGKGFAVVAHEVKELADQTAKATDVITEVIDAVSAEIAGVVSTIEAIGQSISAVNDNSTTVAAAVEQQSAALTEISSSIGVVSTQTASVADNVKGVEDKVGETHELASNVGALSQTLKESSAKMSGEIDRFLRTVTAEDNKPGGAGRTAGLG